jgi:hypothetical protein
MKNLAVCILSVGLLLFLASSTWAVPIAEVGGLDPLISATRLSPSGAQQEADWLNGLLGTNFDNNYIDNNKIQPITWEEVIGGTTGQYAFQLPDQEAYFLVKTGNGTFDHWLFQNDPNTIWGTVVVGGSYLLPGPNPISVFFDVRDIESISHIVPAVVSVPEPSALILIGVGAGIIAFASYIKKEKDK